MYDLSFFVSAKLLCNSCTDWVCLDRSASHVASTFTNRARFTVFFSLPLFEVQKGPLLKPPTKSSVAYDQKKKWRS